MFPWLSTYRWAAEAGVATLIVSALLWYHHHVYETGVAAVRQQDAVALAAARATAEAETTKLTQQAEEAAHAHDQELSDLRAYRDSHPVQPVRLCFNANHSEPRVPAAAGSDASHGAAGARAADVQPVPAGDSGIRPGSGPDISGLLEALAGRADQVSAQLREYQAAP